MAHLAIERKACIMYELTKLDIAALRACDYLVVEFDARDKCNHVYATKTATPSERDPFAQDARHFMQAPVSVRVYRSEDTSHANARAHMRVYRGFPCDVRSVLGTLRAGDSIAFEFCAGAHSTDAILDAGFHGDILRVRVRRKGSTDYQNDDQFTIDSRVGETGHRMVRGLIPAPKATA